MLLTTKQVRAIAKQAGFASADYTDKTSMYDDTRRSVVWSLSTKDADALAKLFEAEFARLGVENTVKRTGVASSWFNWVDGGDYVRVIATLG